MINRFFCYLLMALFFSSTPTVLSLTPPVKENTQEKDEATTSASEVYKIVGIPGSGPQYLPKTYVKTFPRWILDQDKGKLVRVNEKEDDNVDGSCDSSSSSSSSDTVSVQPTLNFLLKGGKPTYVFVGLSVGAPNDNAVGSSNNNQHYLAQQWTTFAATAERNFRIELFLGPGDGTDDVMGVVGGPKVKKYLGVFGQLLATTDENELASGFHIVTIAMKLMDTSTKMQTNQKTNASTITCVAASDSNAKQMIAALDDDDQQQQTEAAKRVSKLSMDATKIWNTV